MQPVFRDRQTTAAENTANQDLTDYLVDGDWAALQPWMYLKSLDEVMTLLNQNAVPVSYYDLGRLPSIRIARTMLESLL